MVATATQIHTISTDETRNVSVDMTGLLDSGELLTGTPTVEGSASLTFTNQQVNVSELTIDGATVAVGKAVQFTVSSSVQSNYKVEIVVATDGSQTVEAIVQINVRNTIH